MAELIKCAAIDDEPLALDIIAKFCDRIGGIDLRTFSDPRQGIDYINLEKPAVVFLDIEMENISGLSIAAALPRGTCFIFTTAYLDYALDGFELDAVDYLHKPFAFARFRTAFEKALRRIKYSASTQELIVRQEYSNVKIAVEDIMYVEAMEGYVKIFKANGECVISRMILKNAEASLPKDKFIRIHRSFIVARYKIRRFNKREIELDNGKILPIGRQYAAEITKIISGGI